MVIDEMAMEDLYLAVIEIDEGTSFCNLANEIFTEIIPRCGFGSGLGRDVN